VGEACTDRLDINPIQIIVAAIADGARNAMAMEFPRFRSNPCMFIAQVCNPDNNPLQAISSPGWDSPLRDSTVG
jgi:hypothetical protein